MSRLFLDLESYSSAPIAKTGAERYALDPSTKILMVGYAFDDDPVNLAETDQGQALPAPLLEALADPAVEKWAHNAAFERAVLRAVLGLPCPPEQWRCTAVWARTLGLPAGLAALARELKLSEQKLDPDKRLVTLFCTPAGRQGQQRLDHAQDWEDFKGYCRRDVEVCRAIATRLVDYPVPEEEWALWALDQHINDRGLPVDTAFVARAQDLLEQHTTAALAEAKEHTGLANPRSRAQMLEWANAKTRQPLQDLRKGTVAEHIEDDTTPEEVRVALEQRQQLASTSVAKYSVITERQHQGRLYGTFLFYGAGRTGRWCLTGDHEVLTPGGWVALCDWRGGPIACWNAAYQVSFQDAEAVSFDYTGPLHRFESQRMDQLATPDHAMPVYREGRTEMRRKTCAETLSGRWAVPFYGWRDRAQTIGADALRVLVMTQADGHYADGRLRFHFRKPRKIERCKTLLRRAGVSFAVTKHPAGTVSVFVPLRCAPLWLRMFRDKAFGSWLLDEDPAVLFDELEHWDGTRTAPNSIQYVTANADNAGWIQACAVTSGRSATVHRRAQAGWSDSWVVNLWTTPGPHCSVKTRTVEAHEGRVYCAVTSTGYFLVRRNGKVWVTGNSGRGFQPHNLPRGLPGLSETDLATARGAVFAGDLDWVRVLFGADVTGLLSTLVRTAIAAPTGRGLVVADYASIESVMLAWAAGSDYLLGLYRDGRDAYKDFATHLFGVPYEAVTKAQRTQAKPAVLGCGYGLGAAGLQRYAATFGRTLDPAEASAQVAAYRTAYPEIPAFWRDVETAVRRAMSTGKPRPVGAFTVVPDLPRLLFVMLPSGRCLSYYRPRLEEGTYGDQLTYVGREMAVRVGTHPGKLTENLIQAISRDVLAYGLTQVAKDPGLEIVGHVHDEIICLADAADQGALGRLTEAMTAPPWCPDAPIRAVGWAGPWYRKD